MKTQKSSIKFTSIALIIMLALSSVIFVGCGGNSSSGANTATNDEGAVKPEDYAGKHHAVIDIESYGKITVELDGDAAPITVKNFITLSNQKFYDGLTFHRIIKDFMMQGGDPAGNGTGGSENNIVGEFDSNGHENGLSHTRGVISMARAQDPNSASSQFFICHADSDFLDGDYAAFGIVTEGLDVVDAVCENAKPTDNNGTIPAEDQPVITSVKIRTE